MAALRLSFVEEISSLKWRVESGFNGAGKMERGRAQRAHKRCVPWRKYVDMRPSMAEAQEEPKGDCNSTRGWRVRTQARRECDVRDADAR